MTTTRDFDALVLDIEGTTTPISFVYDALFPYAARAFEAFLRENSQDLTEAFEALAEQARGGQLRASRNELDEDDQERYRRAVRALTRARALRERLR